MLGGTAGVLLSWIFFVSPDPWLLDNTGNRNLIVGQNNITINQWLESLSSNLTNDQVEPIIRQMLHVHYKFSSLVFLLASILIVFIVFLAPRNRALNLLTHIAFGIWLILFGIVMKPFAENSRHMRFYLTLVALNIVGTITYVIYLFKVQKLIREKNK